MCIAIDDWIDRPMDIFLQCFHELTACGPRVGGAHPMPFRARSLLLGCRLKACSTGFPVFFKRADGTNGRVFLAAQLFLPFLFFLGQCSLEGCGLAAVEVQGWAFEEGDVLRDEDVLDG